MTLRRLLLALLGMAMVAAAGVYLFRAPLSLALAQRFADRRMAADLLAELPDGLHVGLCGAGSPLPDDERSGPCTVVVAGRHLFVFDAGSGSSRNIGRLGFNQGRIEAIFLTHFHSDHIDGLGELMLQRWVSAANDRPVPVHGPAGVDTVVAGFLMAYGPDRGYRVAHHGEATVPSGGFGGIAMPFDTGSAGRVVVHKDADLEIVAFEVDHGPVHPAVGYRISYKGRTVVLSGDTRKSSVVAREAVNADLLVHEALSEPILKILQAAAARAGREKLRQILVDIVNYHTSPEEVAEIARDAKVRYLLLNHIVPSLPLPGMKEAFLGNAAQIYAGPIRIGADGDFVSLPSASTEVAVSRRF